MKLNFVIPNMEKTFGTLEFAGIAEPQRGDTVRTNTGGTRYKYRRYKLYSSVQRADDIEVVVEATREEPKFEYMQEIKLINPRITATGYAINGRGYTDYILSADGIAKA